MSMVNKERRLLNISSSVLCQDNRGTEVYWIYSLDGSALYPIVFEGCAGIIFTHGVWAGGGRKKLVPALSQRP